MPSQASTDAKTIEFIEREIATHEIIMFVKGSLEAPVCGFSNRAMQLLKSLGVECKYIDVLPDPKLREGIKQYTDWPTVPQLYVRQKFIGGYDIMSELHQKGELIKILQGGAN